MKCRKLQEQNLVWFNSSGLNPNGTKISAQNFSEGPDATKDSLTQRLKILRGELWYAITYGIPLTEKIKSKVAIDSHVLSVVSSHIDVLEVIKFESSMVGTKYTSTFTARTTFGNILLTI